MPISNYPPDTYAEGETYVAFLDICGFKKMMKRGIKAKETLNKFYNTIYNVQRHFHDMRLQRDLLEVDAIVVSDCAILFSRNRNSHEDRVKGLRSILTFIRQTNRHLIASRRSPPIVATCSIAYGKFEYKDRFEIKGLEKEFFIGWAYVKAFEDNAYGKTKIRPGQCRLLKTKVRFPRKPRKTKGSVFSSLKKARKYYYFHWMLPSLRHLKQFSQDYDNAYRLKDPLRYEEIIRVVQKYVNMRNSYVYDDTMHAKE